MHVAAIRAASGERFFADHQTQMLHIAESIETVARQLFETSLRRPPNGSDRHPKFCDAWHASSNAPGSKPGRWKMRAFLKKQRSTKPPARGALKQIKTAIFLLECFGYQPVRVVYTARQGAIQLSFDAYPRGFVEC